MKYNAEEFRQRLKNYKNESKNIITVIELFKKYIAITGKCEMRIPDDNILSTGDVELLKQFGYVTFVKENEKGMFITFGRDWETNQNLLDKLEADYPTITHANEVHELYESYMTVHNLLDEMTTQLFSNVISGKTYVNWNSKEVDMNGVHGDKLKEVAELNGYLLHTEYAQCAGDSVKYTLSLPKLPQDFEGNQAEVINQIRQDVNEADILTK